MTNPVVSLAQRAALNDLWQRRITHVLGSYTRKLNILELGFTSFSPVMEILANPLYGKGFQEKIASVCLPEWTDKNLAEERRRVLENSGIRLSWCTASIEGGFRIQQNDPDPIVRFDVVILESFFTTVRPLVFPQPHFSSDPVLVEYLQNLERLINPGASVLVGDYYCPIWASPIAGVGDTFPASSLSPAQIIQLATFEASKRSEITDVRRPLFRLKTQHQPDLPREQLPNSYMLDDFDLPATSGEDHLPRRYCFLVLERTPEHFDEAHLVEAGRVERQEFLRLLPAALDSLLSANSALEERDILQKLLSPDSDLGAYGRISRALFFQLLWSSYAIGMNIERSSVEFWLAYQSPRTGMLPAVAAKEAYPLYGYGYGNHFADFSATWSVSRYWLNIILSEGFLDNDGGVLVPPSVHDWFVKHCPQVENGTLETLAVYVPNNSTRRASFLRGYRAPARHHSIELSPYQRSGQGELWGYQLASSLAQFESLDNVNSPYKTCPWPFDPHELSPTGTFTQSSFLAEGRRLRTDLESGAMPRPSTGWLRCQLYSIFLAMVLGEVLHDELGLPEWVDFYLKVLKILGYEELHARINQAYIDSLAFLVSQRPSRPTSLVWLAPPTKEQPAAIALGSVLLVSTELLPVSSLASVQETVFTTFSALRSLEETVERERTGKRLSHLNGQLAGIDQTVEGFSHEISKLTSTIFQHSLKTFPHVFSIKGVSRPEVDEFLAWPIPAGVAQVDEQNQAQVSKWLISETPDLLESLVDILQIWASSRELREKLGLDKDISFRTALQAIVALGVRAGVAAENGPSVPPPLSFDQARDIEMNFWQDVSFLTEKLQAFSYDGEELIWSGQECARKPQMWFIRMLAASIYNAVLHMDWENPALTLAVRSTKNSVEISLRNSCKPTDENDWDPMHGGTKSVIRGCLRYLNQEQDLPAEPFFYFDPTEEDRHRWLTKMEVTRIYQSHQGERIQWLRTLL